MEEEIIENKQNKIDIDEIIIKIAKLKADRDLPKTE